MPDIARKLGIKRRQQVGARCTLKSVQCIIGAQYAKVGVSKSSVACQPCFKLGTFPAYHVAGTFTRAPGGGFCRQVIKFFQVAFTHCQRSIACDLSLSRCAARSVILSAIVVVFSVLAANWRAHTSKALATWFSTVRGEMPMRLPTSP